MTRNDLLMIKGVRRVEESYSAWILTLWISPWWLWSKKRRTRLEATLQSRLMVGHHYRLRLWWW